MHAHKGRAVAERACIDRLQTVINPLIPYYIREGKLCQALTLFKRTLSDFRQRSRDVKNAQIAAAAKGRLPDRLHPGQGDTQQSCAVLEGGISKRLHALRQDNADQVGLSLKGIRADGHNCLSADRFRHHHRGVCALVARDGTSGEGEAALIRHMRAVCDCDAASGQLLLCPFRIDHLYFRRVASRTDRRIAQAWGIRLKRVYRFLLKKHGPHIGERRFAAGYLRRKDDLITRHSRRRTCRNHTDGKRVIHQKDCASHDLRGRPFLIPHLEQYRILPGGGGGIGQGGKCRIGRSIRKLIARIDVKGIGKRLLPACSEGRERDRRMDPHRIGLQGDILCRQGLSCDLNRAALRAHRLLFAVADQDLDAVLARILRREDKGILCLVGEEVDFLARIVEHEGIAVGRLAADSLDLKCHLILCLHIFAIQRDLCDLQGMLCNTHLFGLCDFTALRISDEDMQGVGPCRLEDMTERIFRALRTFLLHEEGIGVRRKAALGFHGPGNLFIGHGGCRVTGEGCDSQGRKRNLKVLIGPLCAVALIIQNTDGHAVYAVLGKGRIKGIRGTIAPVADARPGCILQFKRVPVAPHPKVRRSRPCHRVAQKRTDSGGHKGGDRDVRALLEYA